MTVNERAEQLRNAGGDPVEPYWAEARIEELEYALARARAVLDDATPSGEGGAACEYLIVDRAAWMAWKEGER